MLESGIQLNRWARHLSARQLTSSDSGSSGGRGWPKFCRDLGERFNNRPTRLFPPVCWRVGSAAFNGDVEKSSSGLPPGTVGLALRAGDMPCVGEGGGVTVVATRRCFSRTLSSSWVKSVSTEGTSWMSSRRSSFLRAMLRSSLGEASSSDAVCNITSPRGVVTGCCTSCKCKDNNFRQEGRGGGKRGRGGEGCFWVGSKLGEPLNFWVVMHLRTQFIPDSIMGVRGGVREGEKGGMVFLGGVEVDSQRSCTSELSLYKTPHCIIMRPFHTKHQFPSYSIPNSHISNDHHFSL